MALNFILNHKAVAMMFTSAKCKKKEKIDAGGDPRSRALALAVQQVNSSYGKGSLINMGDSRPVSDVDVVSTGSIGLDLALGTGGLPRGRIVEIYGPEASGKTTVALQCVAQCQKSGGSAVFIDAEHALDPAYSTNIGVDMHSLLVSQPDSGEQALGIVETLVRSSAVDLVVVDSVAALVPKAELEGEMGDSHIALQARLMSQALRKLTGEILTSAFHVNNVCACTTRGNCLSVSCCNLLLFSCTVEGPLPHYICQSNTQQGGGSFW